MKASEEIIKLDSKEGNLTELARQYLDAKKVNYSVLKAEPGDRVARPKGGTLCWTWIYNDWKERKKSYYRRVD